MDVKTLFQQTPENVNVLFNDYLFPGTKSGSNNDPRVMLPKMLSQLSAGHITRNCDAYTSVVEKETIKIVETIYFRIKEEPSDVCVIKDNQTVFVAKTTQSGHWIVTKYIVGPWTEEI